MKSNYLEILTVFLFSLILLYPVQLSCAEEESPKNEQSDVKDGKVTDDSKTEKAKELTPSAVVLKKHIFLKYRPRERSERPAKETKPDAPVVRDYITLAGIAEENGTRTAFIEHNLSGRLSKMKAGDKIKEMTITEIESGYIVLKVNESDRTVNVGDSIGSGGESSGWSTSSSSAASTPTLPAGDAKSIIEKLKARRSQAK